MTDKEIMDKYPWLRVIDEALIISGIGVLNTTDDYETARKKLGELIQFEIDTHEYFTKNAS